MNTLLKHLLLGASATALAAGATTAALAQNNNAASSTDVETITSSASRIDLKGFEAPTPVTVIGIDMINRDARVDLGDQIRNLPQVGGSSITSGSNSGNFSQVNAGADTVSIRGLGAQRNLVLYDHQRVVASDIQDGTVDISLIPSGLTERVDVVTGGASAAWGSDAVTGVINVVLNKTFEGFKGNATYSNNPYQSGPIYKASVAWGTSFLGGKIHTVWAADMTLQNDAIFPGAANHRAPTGKSLVYNTAYCNSIVYPTGKTTSGTCASLSGQTLRVYAYGLGSTSAIVGGLTTANTAGVAGAPTAANGLKGLMFTGPDATPSSFNYGTLSGTASCYNGCTNNQFGNGGWGPNNPYHSSTFFNYTSYQITPDIKASVQLNLARLTLRSYGNQIGGTGKTIYADNPYLDDGVAQGFVCNGGATFGTAGSSCIGTLSNGYNPYTHQNQNIVLSAAQVTAGTTQLDAQRARPAQTMTMGFEFSGNRQNNSPSSTQLPNLNNAVEYSMASFCEAIYQSCGWYKKVMSRGVFTLEGSLGDSWAWNTFLEVSNNRTKEVIQNNTTLRFNNAIDAVRVTSGNVGTTGLPVGSIQCRGLLSTTLASTAPAAGASYGITTAGEIKGCVPFDPFGLGIATVATREYVNPELVSASSGVPPDVALITLNEVEWSASMQGVLPWQLPAGEIGVSFGAEYRLEQSSQVADDPRSILAMYPSGNFGNTDMHAHLHSEEGFLEIAAPILKDTFVQTLDVDAAVRITDYSFSGLNETWKIGATSQLTDDFKMRVTWSYDIRAPDNWDLYGPGALGQMTCASFVVGPTSHTGNPPGSSNSCFNAAGGNPLLQPEKSTTVSAGLVMTPHWIDGLTASVDWYQLHLHGALYTPGLGTVISRCQTGETVYCAQLVFDQPGSFTPAQGCGNSSFGAMPAPGTCIGGNTDTQIDFVHVSPVNAALLTTAGFDMNVAYGFDLFTGSATVGVNANYVYDWSQTLNGIYFQGAGGGGYYGGGAKLHGTLNLGYREGAWSFGTQINFTGDSISDLGNEGNPAIACSAFSAYTRITVTGPQQQSPQDIISTTSGQRCAGSNLNPTNYNRASGSMDFTAGYRWSSNVSFNFRMSSIMNSTGGGNVHGYSFAARFNY